MSGAPSVIEQATPLAPPEQHAEQNAAEDGFIDLDAGDSLLDQKPDNGRDTSEQDAPASEEAESEPESEVAGEDGEEPELSDDELLETLSTSSVEKPKKPSGSARLKAQLAEAQAEIDRLRSSVPRSDNAADLSAAVERELGPAPRETDYQDYLAFQNASIAYESAKMLVARELKKAAEGVKSAAEQQSRQLVETFQERAHEVRSIVKDFDSVLKNATVSPSNREVAMALIESEKGPHIAYYLAKNPEKVHSINAMPLRAALKEIGQLEARLTPAPQKQTKAPEPVKPLKSGSKIDDPDPEKMTQRQFNEWFDKRKKSLHG